MLTLCLGLPRSFLLPSRRRQQHVLVWHWLEPKTTGTSPVPLLWQRERGWQVGLSWAICYALHPRDFPVVWGISSLLSQYWSTQCIVLGVSPQPYYCMTFFEIFSKLLQTAVVRLLVWGHRLELDATIAVFWWCSTIVNSIVALKTFATGYAWKQTSASALSEGFSHSADSSSCGVSLLS